MKIEKEGAGDAKGAHASNEKERSRRLDENSDSDETSDEDEKGAHAGSEKEKSQPLEASNRSEAKRDFNQLLVSYGMAEKSERDSVVEELMYFYDAGRTALLREMIAGEKKKSNVDFTKNRNCRTPRLSVGSPLELKQGCLIFVKVMKKVYDNRLPAARSKSGSRSKAKRSLTVTLLDTCKMWKLEDQIKMTKVNQRLHCTDFFSSYGCYHLRSTINLTFGIWYDCSGVIVRSNSLKNKQIKTKTVRN